jgi:hypothetical protein
MSELSEKEVSEIKSLITLLDDEDEVIYCTVRERLLSYKESALEFIPFIEDKNTVAERRLSEVREILIRASFKEQLRQLKRNKEGENATMISMFQFIQNN